LSYVDSSSSGNYWNTPENRKLTLTTDGLLGVGSFVDPLAELHIQNDDGEASFLMSMAVDHEDVVYRVPYVANSSYEFKAVTGAQNKLAIIREVYSDPPGEPGIQASPEEFFTILANGNVGIGISDPQVKLETASEVISIRSSEPTLEMVDLDAIFSCG